MYLVTGAGGGVGSVSRRVVELLLDSGQTVRAMVHHEDGRAGALRELGADVVVGDLTEPQDVIAAMRDVDTMFFNMSVSPELLEATAIVCAAARERGDLKAIVNMSQMTVSEMTLTSSQESYQQRLHWLSEHVMNWSGVPVTHIRPTVFMDNPIFTILAAPWIDEHGVLPLPFGDGRTSPIAAADVARVIATVLADPPATNGTVYELTGPELLDINGLAAEFAQGLNQPIVARDIPYSEWLEHVLKAAGLPQHTEQHLATIARLHRQGRFERATDTVEQVTGRLPQTLAQYVAANRDSFSRRANP